jgi:hypothetical protein
MKLLINNITDLDLWGFEKGLWWQKGSGKWIQDGGMIKAYPGNDPDWTWITSPYSYPAEFELTFEISGEAEMAGIGFGPFKDFLVPKPAEPDPISVRFVMQRRSSSMYRNEKPFTTPKEYQLKIEGIETLRDGHLQLKVLKPKGPVGFYNIFLNDLRQ